MKKLILLVCLFVGIGMSASVMAQGTGIAPQVGTTHTYSVTAHGANTFAWSVTSDAPGLTSVVGTVASMSATTGASITITWDNPVIGTTYFVHVIETADGTTCVNRKAIAVKPVNAFVLTVASVDLTDADTDNGETYKVCPPDVTVTSFTGPAGGTVAEAKNFVYDYSASVLYYKITASGINTTTTGWSPQFTIGHTETTGATVTAEWSTSIGGTYTTGLNVTGTANDIIVPATNPSIWVKVTIDNGTSAAGLEGLEDQVVTLTLLNAANTSEDENGNDVTALTVANRAQTVNERPATTITAP